MRNQSNSFSNIHNPASYLLAMFNASRPHLSNGELETLSKHPQWIGSAAQSQAVLLENLACFIRGDKDGGNTGGYQNEKELAPLLENLADTFHTIEALSTIANEASLQLTFNQIKNQNADKQIHASSGNK